MLVLAGGSWRTEREAILNMIEKFGGGVYAIVMDSYDYANALTKILPSVAAQKARATPRPLLAPPRHAAPSPADRQC